MASKKNEFTCIRQVKYWLFASCGTWISARKRASRMYWSLFPTTFDASSVTCKFDKNASNAPDM